MDVSLLGSTGGGYGGELRFDRRFGSSDVVVSTYAPVYGLAPSASKVYHVDRGVSIGG